MIRFERSFDYDLIREIMTHPQVYPHLVDDGSPAREDFCPLEHEAIWYIVVRDDDEVLGLWMFTPMNAICVEVHTCILPSAWGDRAHRAARGMVEWIWEHTPWRRIVTNVPKNNRVALRFAVAAGMGIYGVNHLSFLRNGEPIDQVCLGISKPIQVPASDATDALTAFAEVKEG
jgi:RimJ/RimL family protein N-acetyltransferase